MAARGLSKAIGARMRRLRTVGEARDEEAPTDDDLGGGYPQELVADIAQQVGLDWTRATVASIETGRRNLTLEETVLLPVIFSMLLGRPVSLSGELIPPEEIELVEGVTAAGLWVLETLRGVPPYGLEEDAQGWVVPFADPDAAGTIPRHRASRAEFVRDRAALRIDAGVMDRERARVDNEAEDKAARRLGVPVEVLREASEQLWHRRLTDEREARLEARLTETGEATPRSLQAVRGHVTRELLDELRHTLEGPR